MGKGVQSKDDNKKGRGPSHSLQGRLPFAEHAGVSTNGHESIYGFIPGIAGINLTFVHERSR